MYQVLLDSSLLDLNYISPTVTKKRQRQLVGNMSGFYGNSTLPPGGMVPKACLISKTTVRAWLVTAQWTIQILFRYLADYEAK